MTTTTTRIGIETEGFVEIDGESFYGIPDVDRMGPFLMSVLSDSDHWMFVSSRGGLTAGRGDAQSALFPYETDDRLHNAYGVTGPVTLIRLAGPVAASVWEPFSGVPGSGVRRNLYKSVVGNQLVFEEVNGDLGLVFRYRWANSSEHGFVRQASLVNIGGERVSFDMVDGLLNLLPHALDPATYRAMSNLTNAYKRSEVIDPDTRLAVFSLESRISDRAEPSEALTASVAWSTGLGGAQVGVDARIVEEFRTGGEPVSGALATGRPGAYLLTAREVLDAGEAAHWTIVADIGRDQSQVVATLAFLRSCPDPAPVVEASVRRGTEALTAMMATADGLQCTGDRMAVAHHFANVAFNAMRGGVFVSGTHVDSHDFASFVQRRNAVVAARHQDLLDALPGSVEQSELLEQAGRSGDPHLVRLTLEYLPLTFSRRHGDPSRPWNAFSIRVHDAAGDPVVHYEGNWRDIFQNWEALAMSFPAYLPSMVSVFLNASTPDGFNPYRITRDGIDWEAPEPDNPWSNIGYWGDHQIVYLLRLLEMTGRYLPGDIDERLHSRLFGYADVPYRIAPYDQIVRNPRSTIEYDDDAAARTAARVEAIGLDGKLLAGGDGDVYLVTMVEKLLVPALSKLSNLVPGGGIWMNTQRPEWNDANNALVGNGLSVVTACYLRRYLEHLETLLERAGGSTVTLSIEVADWLAAVSDILRDSVGHLGRDLSDELRRTIVDRLGRAFSDYRSLVYSAGFTGTRTVNVEAVMAMLEAGVGHLDDTIRRNLRTDGLYNSYNLVHVADGGSTASVETLHPMLEGQVAVLSSGTLPPDERLGVIEALFASSMYRSDQNSFMLYPAQTPPPFLDKNVIRPSDVAGNPLLTALIEAGDRFVVVVDDEGRGRFAAQFRNAKDVAAALDRLATDESWRELVSAHRNAVLEAYEAVFRHHAFTGRSGSMYGYEGIGSIYWHMVAKLLLAVQDSIREARDLDASSHTVDGLVGHYWRVRSGLGFEKTASEFGAFPTDPYSHTPAHAGAQQPGMTGQVKEEILTRLLEVGVSVEDGELRFDPTLLRARELLDSAEQWRIWGVDQSEQVVEVPARSLAFTLCQVPVIVSAVDGDSFVEVERSDGRRERADGLTLDRTASASIFMRKADLAAVRVAVPASAFG